MGGVLAGVAALAVFAILVALAPGNSLPAENAQAVAMNLLVYRQAVVTHYAMNPTAGPVVPDAALPLPPGYRQLRDWRNVRAGSGPVFVYGPGDTEFIAVLALEHWRRSSALGAVEGVRLVSPVYGDLGVTVPATVPQGSVAGVVRPN